MHNASLKNSIRLQKVYNSLLSGPKTTRELINLTGCCAINSIMSELKADGISYRCEYLGKTPDGNKIYQYSLEGRQYVD